MSKSKAVKKGTNEEVGGLKLSKTFSILGVVVLICSIYYYYSQLDLDVSDITTQDNMSQAKENSIYDFKFMDIDGVEQSMEKYRGHVLIVVNVASECGYTKSNYEQLTQLYEKYGNSKGLKILGFPCNQFNGQEPLPENQIKTQTCSKFKVTFDMASKVKVNGDDAHPLWKYLKNKQGGTLGSFIKWNFTKFVVDKTGQVVKRYGPSTEPNEMEKDLLQYLNQ
jgi:glutathione peroxidase